MIPLNGFTEVFNLIPIPSLLLEPTGKSFRVCSGNAAYRQWLGREHLSELLSDNLPIKDPAFSESLLRALHSARSADRPASFVFETPEADHEVCITPANGRFLATFIRHPVKKAPSPGSIPAPAGYKMFDNIMEGCQVLNHRGEYLYINEAASRQGKLKKEEYLGRSIYDLYPSFSGSHLESELKACMDEQEKKRVINEFTYSDNSKAWFELHIYPVPEGVLMLSLDITDRKNAEDRLTQHEYRFRMLTELSTDLILVFTPDLKHLYRSPSASKLTGWTDEELNETDTRTLIHEDDLNLLEETLKMSLAYPRKPIRVGFRMRHRKGHHLSLEGTMTNFLDDKLLSGLVLNVHDVTRTRESEQWLKKNQHELKQAHRMARMGYVHFDLAGHNSFGSEEMHEIWETNPETFELSLDNFLKTIHPDDKKRFEEFLLKLFAGFSSQEIEYRIKLPSGNIRHIFQRTELEHDAQGKVSALNCILLNITERRQAETALHESDEKFRRLFNSSPLPQWLFDCETLFFIDVNDAAVKNYGYSREEFLSMTIEDIRPEAEVERLLKAREKIRLHQGDFKDRTFIHRKKNGELINVDIKSAHVSINGRNARVVIARDITTELAFERQLIESNERYNLVLEATNESIIDWDIENDTTIWGKGFEKNFGYDLSRHDNHLWSRNIHENDRDRVLTALGETLEDQRKRNFDAEFAYVKANGEIAYVQHRGIILRNHSGQPIRAIGAMIDVTELKEKISEIEKHNRNLRNIAWTQSHIVRAPLARLIGLIKLIENKPADSIDPSELSKILTFIVTSAYELDKIIKDIVKKTETLHQ